MIDDPHNPEKMTQLLDRVFQVLLEEADNLGLCPACAYSEAAATLLAAALYSSDALVPDLRSDEGYGIDREHVASIVNSVVGKAMDDAHALCDVQRDSLAKAAPAPTHKNRSERMS